MALLVVSLGTMRGMLVGSRWAARAAAGALLLIAVSLLSAAISVHRGKSLEAMINLFAIAGLFLAAAFLLRGNRLLRSVALLEVLAAVPVAAFGLAQHFRPDILPPGNPYPGRALGPFGQPNRLGGYLIAIVPVAIALSFAVQDRVLRVALLAAVSCLTLCLVATYSRGAWLGLAAGLVALGVIVASTPGLMPRPALAIAAGVALVLPAVWLASGHRGPAPTRTGDRPRVEPADRSRARGKRRDAEGDLVGRAPRGRPASRTGVGHRRLP
jgi:O-antigen ligase